MTMHLYSYSAHSEGAKALADALNINRIKHENSRFRGGPNKVVINWGCSELPDHVKRGPLGNSTIINSEEAVKRASNKLDFLNHLHMGLGAYLPPFTTDINHALMWQRGGHSVVARKLLRASGARGLEIIDPDDPMPEAPLYTKYLKKNDEYRVHVVRGEVIDVQRKGLSAEFQGQDDINWRVRNLANGFIFVRNDGREVSQNVKVLGQEVIRQLGLDFGAVDIIKNKAGSVYALEANTAPGLVGSTVESYRAAFSRLI